MTVQTLTPQQRSDSIQHSIGSLENSDLPNQLKAIQEQIDALKKEAANYDPQPINGVLTEIDLLVADLQDEMTRVAKKIDNLHQLGRGVDPSDEVGSIKEQLGRLWDEKQNVKLADRYYWQPSEEAIQRTLDLAEQAAKILEIGKLEVPIDIGNGRFSSVPFIEKVIDDIPQLAIGLVVKKIMPKSYCLFDKKEVSLGMGLILTIAKKWQNFNLSKREQEAKNEDSEDGVEARAKLNKRTNYLKLIDAMRQNGYDFRIDSSSFKYLSDVQIPRMMNLLLREIEDPHVFDVNDAKGRSMLVAILELVKDKKAQVSMSVFFIFWGAPVNEEDLGKIKKTNPNLHAALEFSLKIRDEAKASFGNIPYKPSELSDRCLKILSEKSKAKPENSQSS